MAANNTTPSQPESQQIDPVAANALSDIYAFLALTMRFPEAAFSDIQFIDAFKAILASLEWDQELDEVSKWQAESKNLLEDLQVAYTQLFINSARRNTVPPYASVYLDGDGSIQGKSTEAIQDFYLQCGYEVIDPTEPADHIQHQLEFLSALVRDQQFDQENAFLTTYFRPWFTQFHYKFNDEARHPFYRVSMQLIDFFTKEEQ